MSNELVIPQVAIPGKEQGKKWVKDGRADQSALINLSSQCDNVNDLFFSSLVLSAYSDAERLYFLMYPDDDGDRKEARGFWESQTEESIDSDFLSGFVEGALEVWGKVKGQE